MKIKKLYSYSDKKQIWRLLLSDSEKLVLETRDMEKKEVFYHCLDLFSGKVIIRNYQPTEKYWISIEAIKNDIILFHKYSKPDMPGHQFIQAFDINTKSVLWQNEEYVFMFVDDNGMYCYEKSITGNKYYLVDLRTGKIESVLELSEEELALLNKSAGEIHDYGEHLFPEKFYPSQKIDYPEDLAAGIISEINLLEIVGHVEYVAKNNLLFFNFHFREENRITNRLIVKDIIEDKIIYQKILNKNVNAYATDSFFIYKDLLLFLREKNEVVVCKVME